jgi:hypothetical protein
MTEVSVMDDARKAKGRSAVTNGGQLPGVDGRSPEARRGRDILDRLIVEFDITSEADMALARSYASQRVWSEQQEALLYNGETISGERLIRSANTQRRLYERLQESHRKRLKAARGGRL